MNANSSDSEEVIMETPEAAELVQVAGCARSCVNWAQGLVFEFADSNNENPNDYQFYMDVYMRYYSGCIRGC